MPVFTWLQQRHRRTRLSTPLSQRSFKHTPPPSSEDYHRLLDNNYSKARNNNGTIKKKK